MTRQQILNTFAVTNGCITNPGKFENQMLYAPHFADTASDGEELACMEDGNGEYASLIEVDEDDRREFPELGAAQYVLYQETNQGFSEVSLVWSEMSADQIRESYEPEDE